MAEVEVKIMPLGKANVIRHNEEDSREQSNKQRTYE